MVVGIAFSGGGITALLAALCALSAIEDLTTTETDIYAAVSGGSVGLLIRESARNENITLDMPPSNLTDLFDDATTAYDRLKDRTTSETESKTWYGSILDYTPHDTSFSSLLALLRTLGVLPKVLGKNNWWMLALGIVLEKAYGIQDPKFSSGKGYGHIIGFNLVAASACPYERDESKGYLVPDEKGIADFCPAWAVFGDTESMAASACAATNTCVADGANVEVRCGADEETTLRLKKEDAPFDAMESVGASSSFWNAEIVSGSSVTYDLLKGWLKSYETTSSSDVFAMDGGVVDTTGIVGLLRKRTDRIVLFYNDNNDLAKQNASLSFLFGVDADTNSMNSLQGPTLSKVFADGEAMYDAMMRNLTDPNILRASFVNVSVASNDFFGVEAYTLEHLYVLSNQRPDGFVSSFSDPAVASHLDEKWPNGFDVAMDDFNANMLCLFNRWKVETYADELREILTTKDA